MRTIMKALRLLLVMTVLTGLAYPLSMTGLAQALLPSQANGSLVVREGVVVGSKLIGQNFSGEEYFHSRPSAAGNNGYDGANSSGTNLGPTNTTLVEKIKNSAEEIRQANGLKTGERVPADLVTASASGLDPDISPEAAYLQVERVAKARGMKAGEVRQLIDAHLQQPQVGLFGDARFNVLELNLALDAVKGH